MCTSKPWRSACVCPGSKGTRAQHVRTFGTTAAEFLALRDWLEAHGVTHVAMESTGVYWKPIYYVLEERFTCLLVNAAHVKQVPGPKTTIKDCEWIAQLLEHGLLRGSFVPPATIRELRADALPEGSHSGEAPHRRITDEIRTPNRIPPGSPLLTTVSRPTSDGTCPGRPATAVRCTTRCLRG
jgi:hypothetical protein